MFRYQKGFLPIWLLVVFIVIAGAAAVASRPSLKTNEGAMKNKYIVSPTSTSTSTPYPSSEVEKFSDPDISTWKTYHNEEYGFEVKYPGDWGFRPSGDGLFINSEAAISQGGENGGMTIYMFTQYEGKTIEDIFSGKGNTDRPINLERECKKISFSRVAAFDCFPAISFAGERVIIFLQNNVLFEINDYIQNNTTNKILSTFKFLP